jgi:hypothetical protein
MLALTQDVSSIDAVQNNIKFMRLIGEAAIVMENVLSALFTAHLWHHADGFITRW